MPKRKPESEKLIPRHYLIHPKTLEKIDKIAEDRGWEKSLVVRTALELGLAAMGKGDG